MMDQKTKKQRSLTLLLFGVYLVALSWAVLFKMQFSVPVMENGRVLNLIPLLGSFDDDGVLLFSEIRINILAFIPFGIYLCMLKRSWPFVKKTLSVFILSFVFEAAQFIFTIGRADITDVLVNTLGGVIGMGLYALIFSLMKSKTNRIVNGLAAAFTVFALLLVAVLLATHRWVRFQ